MKSAGATREPPMAPLHALRVKQWFSDGSRDPTPHIHNVENQALSIG
ncbi:MAG: hypothetical protein OER22_14145 [Gammaproteobacteria bacterium]|nr:hypothetical protein [Gammaproteobacteria bacterium]MDH3372013.1 hypothetical protein [Gammaproteobacteria bacterium]MDH3553750.1 hypothetical protein [Gammaproteobacteria bacterium]